MSNPSSEPTRDRLPPRLLLLVFLAAFLGRLVFSYGLEGIRSWDDVDRGGELGRIAANIAEGRGFSDPFGQTWQPTAWFSPLVPLFWSMLFEATGVFSERSLHILLVLQAFLGAAVALGFTHLLHQLGARHAAWAGFCFALWPETLKSHAFPWYFAFQDLGMLAMLVVGLRWIRQPNLLDAILLSLVTGLALLVNPIPLLWLAVLLAYGVCRRFRVSTVFHAALVCALVAAILTPWSLRNQWRLQKAQPFRGNFGVELRQGNAPDATLVQSAASRHPALDAGELRAYREWGEAVYEGRARAEAMDFIRAEPGLFIKRSLIRVYLFWCGDLFDQHPWASRKPWWTLGLSGMAPRLLLIMSALSLVAAALLALARGRLFTVPHAALWLGMVVLVPAPYYVTHVVALYPLSFKPYLLLWVLAAWLPRRPVPVPAGGNAGDSETA
jgi:hypothetical protein